MNHPVWQHFIKWDKKSNARLQLGAIARFNAFLAGAKFATELITVEAVELLQKSDSIIRRIEISQAKTKARKKGSDKGGK